MVDGVGGGVWQPRVDGVSGGVAGTSRLDGVGGKHRLIGSGGTGCSGLRSMMKMTSLC